MDQDYMVTISGTATSKLPIISYHLPVLPGGGNFKYTSDCPLSFELPQEVNCNFLTP